MKKLAILTFAILVAGSLPAAQLQRDQKQQTNKTTKNRHQHRCDKPEVLDDPELVGLKTDMAAIVTAMQNNQANVDNAANEPNEIKPVEKKHERICPTCGRSAELCSVDADRIAHGEILTCGCRECSGAVGVLWASQFLETVCDYAAQKTVRAFYYAASKINNFMKGGS